MASVLPQFMTVAEAATTLRLSKKTIRRMLQDGRLVAHRASGRVLVDAGSVTRLLSVQVHSAPTTEPPMAENNDAGTRLVRRLKYTKEWTGRIAGLEVALGTSDEEEAKTRLLRAQMAWKKIEHRESQQDAVRAKCLVIRDGKTGYILRHQTDQGERKSKRVAPLLARELVSEDVRDRYAVIWYLANVESSGVAPVCPASAGDSGPPTVSSVGSQWFNGELTAKYGREYVKPKKSARDDRLRFDRYIEPAVGNVPVADIRGERAAYYADAILARVAELSPDASPATRRQVLQVFNRILNLAVFPLRILESNDLPRGYLPAVRSNKRFNYLMPEEESQLLACTDVPLVYRVFFGVLDREGLRVSELRELRWENLDLERGLLTLDQNKTDDARVWKMDDGVVAALEKWKERQSPRVRRAGFVIAHPRTGRRFPKGKAAPVLRRSLRKAGIEREGILESTNGSMALRGHDLRSTFITIALANGKTEAWVSDRTGHKSSAMIYRYKRAARTHAEAELGTLSRLDQAIPELAADENE